jgi:hypothetical protein
MDSSRIDFIRDRYLELQDDGVIEQMQDLLYESVLKYKEPKKPREVETRRMLDEIGSMREMVAILSDRISDFEKSLAAMQ